MELRHIRYFVTVAEHLHFGRAAKELRIAQPSLSHQILQLESELQTKLFERTKKRVRLTDAGVRFVEESRQILEHVDRAALIARSGRGQGTQPLRVGFGYWTDVMKMCAVIRRFTDAHPDVRVELYSMSVPQQIGALREAEIDVGFVTPPVTDAGLQTELLLSETFAVAVRKNHRFTREKRVPLEALKDEPIIMPPRDRIPFFYDLTLRLFQDAGFVPKVHHEVDYPTLVLGLVATGVGVSLVPSSVRKIQAAGVTFVPLHPTSRTLETIVAWRRSDMSVTLKDFLQIARETMTARAARRRKKIGNT